MPIIVNLSTVHDYSLDKTMGAFLDLCNKYSPNLPNFFKTPYNWAWLRIQLSLSQSSHIEPYKLGKMTTAEFYDKLTETLYFLKGMDKTERNALLEQAWNASITVSDRTKGRLSMLAKAATEKDPVYLISNTNELNAQAILAAFKKAYPDLEFKDPIDISINNSQEPVEILPNVYLCLSYRFQMFKTDNMLAKVISSKPTGTPFTVVSQWEGDRTRARELGVKDVFDDKSFFNASQAPTPQM